MGGSWVTECHSTGPRLSKIGNLNNQRNNFSLTESVKLRWLFDFVPYSHLASSPFLTLAHRPTFLLADVLGPALGGRAGASGGYNGVGVFLGGKVCPPSGKVPPTGGGGRSIRRHLQSFGSVWKVCGSMSEAPWKRAEACSNSSEARFRVVLACSVWHVLNPEMSDRVSLL